eukprot:CAMPEP_0202835670 /NCGR_PEP_ID=MMETSP1389-20130828/37676_1 /ASSEMBLY_ACC=CAM_ASM_000865 /TAXON_ID=302021 /ORGANISM="Rhodomonas sp., Strain CCMP768" /LENGTH=179 /DNA_ID=CAMNT_0049511251 /DNA_START=27 /DNA_END=567 /DNA_ORIENTATION=-
MNAARRGGKDTYETLADGRIIQVHPSSLLKPFDKDDWAELVVCLEMVWTRNGMMRFVCAANAKWIMELLPKIQSVDIHRLCGGHVVIKKKGPDVGHAQARAEEAKKTDAKKEERDVNDAKARFLARKMARQAATDPSQLLRDRARDHVTRSRDEGHVMVFLACVLGEVAPSGDNDVVAV